MSHQLNRHVILLAGPTGSGKSALALQWAEQSGGLVVNADAMQVYSDLRVLTARPAPADEAHVAHRLYGHVDGAQPHSVALWLEDVAALLDDVPVDRPLIFVGGTGLYLEALTRGLSPVPPVPEGVREIWRERGRVEEAPALHAELSHRDPAMAARLRPSDRQRIIRALEVVDGTGRSLLDWQETTSRPLISEADKVLLTPERADLRERIAQRFERMIAAGALDEVAALLDRSLPPSLPVMKAIGVAPLAAHLRGDISLEQAIVQAVTDSCQYAKRQQTWMRNRFSDYRVIGANERLRA
ncbi:tRNA (adenosine(37)-N6)-dimethylallyltransferase MiaA [Terrihabitans sp. B22-R8]|uniref:tRNA (adenosine(37)-N6)-dimethylallyltransferase MiaA n=1 Tax=Terrihabitans sp. B22-R8 TaxID=3425128 RepID=UPI00403D21BA